MKIKIIQVGKTTESYLREGIEEYKSRLKHYVGLEEITINPVPVKKPGESEKANEQEGKVLLEKVAPGDFLVLLDENGKQLGSREFSNFLSEKINSGTRTMIFMIGGAFGFSDPVYKRADFKLSLSKMTFSHQMVRLFFYEQLYRGFTIMKGEKYHHD